MNSKVISMVFWMACLQLSQGIEIEDKQGRSFDAEIISANEDQVTIRRSSDRREFTLDRENLHEDTDKAINAFLQEKREQEPDANGVPERSILDSFTERRIINLKDNKSVNSPAGPVTIITPGSTFHCTLPRAVEVSGGSTHGFTLLAGARGKLKVLSWMGGLDVCKDGMESRRDLNLESARSDHESGHISSGDLRKIEALTAIRKVEYGDWEGYASAERTKADSRKLWHLAPYRIQLTRGGTGLIVSPVPFPGSIFDESAITEFLNTLTVERHTG